MGFFPTDANDEDEVGPNANGSYFKYVAADDKWILIPNADVYSEAEVDAIVADYLPLAGGELSGNITMAGAQTVDGKDVSGLCTTAEAHAYVEATALTLEQDLSFDSGKDIIVVDNVVDVFQIREGANAYICVSTDDGAEEVHIGCAGTAIAKFRHVEADFQLLSGKSLVFADGGSVDIIRDEDDMATDDANALATQQSIKKYVDDNAGDTKEVSHAYVEANALTLTADVTFNAGQLFDGKDVSTLCTEAEAHAYVEANALTLTADMVSRDITPTPSSGFKYYGVSLDDAYSGMIMSIDTTGCNPGDCVYIDAQNSVAIADATDDTKMPVIGIVVEAGFVLTHGSYRNTGDYAWAAGAGPIYMTTGAGVPDDTPPSGSGNIVQVIGIASGEDCIFVNPSLDWVEIV